MTDAVHKHGAKVVAEIQHAGRQTTRTVSGFQVVGPSAVPMRTRWRARSRASSR